MRALVAAVLLLVATAAAALEIGLSGAEGHPRARFPLAVHGAPLGNASLDAAIRRAVDDWNVLTREVLGIQVFDQDEHPSGCYVIDVESQASWRQMGETSVRIGAEGSSPVPSVSWSSSCRLEARRWLRRSATRSLRTS